MQWHKIMQIKYYSPFLMLNHITILTIYSTKYYSTNQRCINLTVKVASREVTLQVNTGQYIIDKKS